MRFRDAGLFLVLGLGAACVDPCPNRDRAARLLVEDHQACSEDTECVVVDMIGLVGSSCVPAFQCTQAFTVGTDFGALGEEAARLEAIDCGGCSLASCAPADSFEAVCDVEAGRCVLVASGD